MTDQEKQRADELKEELRKLEGKPPKVQEKVALEDLTPDRVNDTSEAGLLFRRKAARAILVGLADGGDHAAARALGRE
jgi:hypothetical protein